MYKRMRNLDASLLAETRGDTITLLRIFARSETTSSIAIECDQFGTWRQ
jgi:hypothetical protein